MLIVLCLYQAAFIYFWLMIKLLWFHFAPRGNKDDGISISFRTLDITLFDKALWYFSPSEVDQGRPPIKVKFEIPYFTVSGIQVTYYKTVVPLIILVINKSDSRLAVVRFCFTLSLVRLQTELDFSQSYHHYVWYLYRQWGCKTPRNVRFALCHENSLPLPKMKMLLVILQDVTE